MDERIIARIAEKHKSIVPFLDERSKRVWAAAEAKSLGRCGINAVRTAIGIGYLPLKQGLQELENPSRCCSLQLTRAKATNCFVDNFVVINKAESKKNRSN